MQPNTVDQNASRKALELFQAALERPRDEREAFLAEACPQDAGLRAEIGKLLAADERNSDVFGAAVEAEAAAFRSSRTDSSSHRHIGPYRLFRELGEGGMGTVYLAGRVDDEFRQQVTIKLIKRGMDSEGILRRFRSERQILASLHHPHIARLLDGGTTDDGLPYFVM
ncbi:MAG: protein kinase, partial [Thermoanaerobaculia bacterium]